MEPEALILDFVRAANPDALDGATDPKQIELWKVLDSLGFIKLVAYLEEEFSITISDEEISAETFKTAESVADFVRSKQA